MNREEEKQKYYQQMGYENILGRQIDRIARSVSARDEGEVRGSILALVHLMPPRTRKSVDEYKNSLNIGSLIHTVTEEEYVKLFDLWDYCNKTLDQCGLLFKVGRGIEEHGTA